MQHLQALCFQITSYTWIILMGYWLYAGRNVKATVRQQSKAERFFYLVLLISAFAFIYNTPGERSFLTAPLFEVNELTIYAGTVINIAGIAFAVAARYWLGRNWSGIVTLKKDHALITRGPYAITRHPIYTGILFGIIGAALVQAQLRGIVAIILYIIAAHIKLLVEEKFMKKNFKDYTSYMKHTKKLVPFIY